MRNSLATLIGVFMVTWDVSGFNLSNCGDARRVLPAIGMCADPVSATRSASFDKREDAQRFLDALKKDASPAYRIGNARMFEETK